jgi:hypothetical protein
LEKKNPRTVAPLTGAQVRGFFFSKEPQDGPPLSVFHIKILLQAKSRSAAPFYFSISEEFDSQHTYIHLKTCIFASNISSFCIVSHCIALYHIISYHILSYRIVSYRIVSVSYRRIVSYHIVSYRIVSYRIVSHRIVSYRIVSYRIISYRSVAYRNVSYRIVSYDRIVSYVGLSM